MELQDKEKYVPKCLIWNPIRHEAKSKDIVMTGAEWKEWLIFELSPHTGSNILGLIEDKPNLSSQ